MYVLLFYSYKLWGYHFFPFLFKILSKYNKHIFTCKCHSKIFQYAYQTTLKYKMVADKCV